MRTYIAIYGGIMVLIVFLGCVLGLLRAPSAAATGVVLLVALVVPIYNLAGHYSRIRYPLVHLAALALLLAEALIVAAVAAGLSRR